VTEFVALVVIGASFLPSIKGEQKNIELSSLPGIDETFSAHRYIHAATSLQEIGKDKACDRLLELARSNKDKGQAIILCRMLFCQREKVVFRSPRFGVPIYLDGLTKDTHWPLSPIEVVDGVPFLVVRRYMRAGEAEPSAHYVQFCIENCDWSSVRFSRVDEIAVAASLRKMLASSKWEAPLSDAQVRNLTNQANK
jgi:hypothetical protein